MNTTIELNGLSEKLKSWFDIYGFHFDYACKIGSNIKKGDKIGHFNSQQYDIEQIEKKHISFEIFAPFDFTIENITKDQLFALELSTQEEFSDKNNLAYTIYSSLIDYSRSYRSKLSNNIGENKTMRFIRPFQFLFVIGVLSAFGYILLNEHSKVVIWIGCGLLGIWFLYMLGTSIKDFEKRENDLSKIKTNLEKFPSETVILEELKTTLNIK